MSAMPSSPGWDRDAARRHDRKEDHVRLAVVQWSARKHAGGGSGGGGSARNEFDDLEFIHHALAAVPPAEVDLGVELAGRRLSSPFYINGMTGGTEHTSHINQQLAIAARQTGLAMACGSVSIALDDPSCAGSFRVIRRENPEGVVMANIGVGRSPADAVRAVDLLDADLLQVHVNAVQETVMPEGSPDFADWLGGIARIVETVPVPVLVKEVGFGLSARTLRQLAGVGVAYADVSGRGGTDFLQIENDRRPDADFSYLSGFGQSAPACLLDAARLSDDDHPVLLASGGVRNPLDVLKCLALGAGSVGVAGVFLDAVVDGGAAALVDLITTWQDHTRDVSALLGARDVAGLRHADLLVRGRLEEYCRLRGIDAGSFSRRSEA